MLEQQPESTTAEIKMMRRREIVMMSSSGFLQNVIELRPPAQLSQIGIAGGGVRRIPVVDCPTQPIDGRI
jgi:hypothetical protein